jgi:2-polyprenyl-3-methyl-5-hydroxy-6-metoxy-1,4-benzoquinol methylase
MSTNQTLSPDEYAEKLFQSALGFIDVVAVYLGDRLGWYRALAADGPATPEELVARTGGSTRYAREWLEQQAVSGVLSVGPDGRFALAKGHAEVLTDENSLAYLAPLARMLGAASAQLPALVQAYRTDGGVGWDQFGSDMRESQSDMNRPWFEHRLAGALAALPKIHAVLSRPDARIADVGCGGGWSSIALARAYPQATVAGYDIDEPSVQLATANATAAGLADRLAFHAEGAAGLAGSALDAIFAFECIHDMADPVGTLREIRRAVKPDGVVVVMDEAVAERFAPGGDDIERLMYGFSLMICLPDGMSTKPSAATGTVMRPDTLREYAREAGFTDLEVLPTGEFGFWRFYRLVP